MSISVIGAGYVGLTTAAGLASKGYNVIIIEADEAKVNLLNQGRAPFSEEGLGALLSDCIKVNGNLIASSDYEGISRSDITLICVGTPSNSDSSINLSYVEDSVKGIGKVLRKKRRYHLVVVRSTVIPGTTRDVIIPLLEKYSQKRVGKDFGIAVNPEFLQQGKALHAFLNPDRIIIGEYDHKAGSMVEGIYSGCGISSPVVKTDVTTAEMIKYASNAFLATKISFINEMGNICKQLGLDVYAVAKGISFDYRIGERFLSAGVGFGGSCLPKDLQALVYASSNRWGYPAHLLQSVLDVNKAQAVKIIELVEQKIGSLCNKKITVLGLAFKPNTDDIRNTPAIRVIEMLLEGGASVRTYDPKAMSNAKQVLPKDVKFCSSASEAINESDCVLILTEWDEFRELSLYTGRTVIDGRRALEPQKAKAVCDYEGICW